MPDRIVHRQQHLWQEDKTCQCSIVCISSECRLPSLAEYRLSGLFLRIKLVLLLLAATLLTLLWQQAAAATATAD